MEKLDLKKLHRPLFTAPADEFVELVVPPLNYVKIDGQGDPGGAPAYAQALAWLYGTLYTMKFDAKKSLDCDFVVPPLQGLWWADDPTSFVERRKSEWCWTMMIMVPDFLGPEHLEAATAKVRAKRAEPPPATLRLEILDEGLCLQALHIGSYDEESPLLARLHDEIMPAQGFDFAGPHHEIYLGDPRKTAPAKLRTILRQPVKRSLQER